jgi:cyclophilin family peptidyl-prolyl cis-trans isomerase
MKKFVFVLTLVFIGISFTLCSQKAEKGKMVVIHTNYGDMKLKLYDETPQHRDNFIKLIKEGWYENSPFHRIIKDFMIQGGGNGNGKQDPGYTIEAEILPQYFHTKGALSAARMPDNVNPEKRSSGSQFYIVHGRTFSEAEMQMFAKRYKKTFTQEQMDAYATIGGAPHLDGDYTVFGELVEGFDVVDKIASVKTVAGNRPAEELTMTIEILD